MTDTLERLSASVSGDFHTHTTASDGRTDIADNIAAAERKGLEFLAITDHSFTNIIFHMTREKFDAQSKFLNEYKSNADNNLKILHGIEGNICVDGTLDIPDDIIRRIDILNVGYHRLLQPHLWRGAESYLLVNGLGSETARKKMIDKNTEVFLKVLENYPVDTVCHLNHRALVDTGRIARAAAEKNVYIELNEKHIETLERDIEIILESGVKFILGSDAHSEEKVGEFPRVAEFISKYGIPVERIAGLNGNTPALKNKKDWRRVNA